MQVTTTINGTHKNLSDSHAASLGKSMGAGELKPLPEDESYDSLFPDLADCVECGHLHWDSKRQVYVSCPIDGCDCRGQVGR